MATKEQVKAYVDVIRVLADSIRFSGSIPAGTLYAACMAHVSLEAFEAMIGILVEGKLVKRDRSGLLHWVGPAAA